VRGEKYGEYFMNSQLSHISNLSLPTFPEVSNMGSQQREEEGEQEGKYCRKNCGNLCRMFFTTSHME
jgi:hypothetical protein